MIAEDKAGLAGKFGTFGGVFTPCTLTILGVIMFLRFGQVVGQAGVYYMIAIVLISKAITTLTAFSLSAIATNTRVKGGGAYYLISRSLGVEFGGAIGVVFYLAQAVSVAMYVIGFTEAFLNAFPALGIDARICATVVNIVVFACVYVGAGWAIKLQYVILVILALSIVSFLTGALPAASAENFAANLSPRFQEGQSFLTMFALFFPAVTGIMAGANMSGDLRDPGRAIPRGTLSAIAATAVIYLGMGLLLAATSSPESLVENNFVVAEVSRWPALIAAGVFAATLSSALGSMMGAPRILQALARDRVFRRLNRFAKGSGPGNEPRLATVLTFVVAQAGILLGSLDAIAPIITMFFMITYGTLNLACFYEAYTGNPSYRPLFRFSHWSVGLAGALGCAAVMLLMEPLWALVAIASMAALHWTVARTEVEARWGDVQSGIAFERARKALLRLEEERYHPKNWRPTILALNESKWSRDYREAEYGYWLTAGHGVLTLGQVISGDLGERMERRRRTEVGLRKFIRNRELEAFPAAIVEPDLFEGVKALLQSHGLGGLRPNTVLLAWEEDPKAGVVVGRIARMVRAFERSVLIVKSDRRRPHWYVPDGTIDVWWRDARHGELMLILAHLLTQNPDWRHRPVRLLHAVATEAEREKAGETLETLMRHARMRVIPEILVTDDPVALVGEVSAGAALAFLGFYPPDEGREAEWQAWTTQWLDAFGDVIMVYNAGDVELSA